MKYERERDWIIKSMREAYRAFAAQAPATVEHKSRFDLVTNIDCAIEKQLSEGITREFPGDLIHGEEMSAEQRVSGRTWTIDPIDGTCNMAHGMPIFGVQCALIDRGEIVLAVVYLPHFDMLFSAVAGEGCLLNGVRVRVNASVTYENAIASFGDYTHNSEQNAAMQHKAIKYLHPRIAKIRMFGAACVDFSFVACGKTDATVVITKNLWDIAPGILLCREAGAIVENLRGEPYQLGDLGVMVCANAQVRDLFHTAFADGYTVRGNGASRSFLGCIFDFDGVIADTEVCYYHAWRKAFGEVGVTLSEREYAPLKSTGSAHILACAERMLGRAFTKEERERVLAVKAASFEERAQALTEAALLPGVQALLTNLSDRSVPLAVASSSKTTFGLLRRLGVDKRFNAILDGALPLPRKPAPDQFLAAARALGLDPEQCLVIEDSQAGVSAAHAAGMSAIAVGGLRDERALLCVNTLAELSERIR